MTSIVKSGAFKIALVFACAVTITTYVVFALVYFQFYASNVRLTRSVLHDEATSSVDTPMDRLRERLQLHLTQDIRHLDYVGLYDAEGGLVFGNLAPDLHVPSDGQIHILVARSPMPSDNSTENAVFISLKRQDGGTLVMGRSLVYAEHLERAMIRGSITALGPVILLALLIGAIVSLRASRRLASIQLAIDRVMQGELHVRLPSRGTNDDVEHLVRAVNKMLDEIVRLLLQLKSVGDNIAHDLRAPLAVMRARLERGLAGQSEQTLRALASEALGDLERAMTTVSALLRISELESGLRRSAFDSVDLTLVCSDVFDLYEPLAEAKGVKLTLDAPAPVVVTGDGDLLREAVANLVDNAIKFTPRTGEASIRCGGSDRLIRVSDSGVGIPEHEREKVLKRFYRAKQTSDIPGVGLGLSMATTIIELHGFGLRILDNAPGAIFDITAEPVHPEISAETSKAAASKGKRSALNGNGAARRAAERLAV